MFWPFNIPAKRREREAQQRREQAKRTLTIHRPNPYLSSVSSNRPSNSYDDPLYPMNPLSPLNTSVFYQQSALAPAEEPRHTSSHCDTSSSHASHSSSDYGSSYSHSSHDHSCSSSSYDSGSSSNSSDW
jgi:hypothetical protein